MTIATRCIVPLEYPDFPGHFSRTPILPGVVATGHRAACGSGGHRHGAGHYEIGSVKFLSPVSAGEELMIQYDITPRNTIRFDIVTAAGRVASGSITQRSPA